MLLWLPPAGFVSRVIALRMAVGLAIVAPVFVAWGGRASDAEIRLRLVGLATAVVLAALWEERCAALTSATPVGLPAVLRGRGLLLVTVLVAGWLGSAAVVASRPGPSHVAGHAVEAAGLAAVVLAVVGLLSYRRDGESIAAYPIPVVLVVLLLASRLPKRWSLLGAFPGSAEWGAECARWAGVLVASLLLVAWLGRDPATR